LVVLSNMASALDQQWASRLRAQGVPVLEGTRSGLTALGRLLDHAARSAPSTPQPVDVARQARWVDRLARGPLSTVEGFALLRDYGIATVEVLAASSRAEVLDAAVRLGWPVVLKTDEDVAHKSDVGGVILGLSDEAALATAYDDLAARLGPRALVCASAPPGTELALGVAVDPLLGTMLVVGAGGVLVEVLGDRSVALPPVDGSRATRLVDRLTCRPLLDGVRGRPAADLAAVHNAVVAMGRLAHELGASLAGLDVNPLVATASGAWAVDVLVVARQASTQPSAQKMA
jgi:acyl-CoA synthetase (NDP forming)